MISLFVFFVISCTVIYCIDAHGYMLWPLSRNGVNPPSYCAHCMNGAGGTRTASRQAAYGNSTAYGIPPTTFPLELLLQKGYRSEGGLALEPNGIAVRHGVCGDPSQNHPDSANLYNQAIKNYANVGTFLAGGEIEIEVILTAHHRGHFEFFLCDTTGMSPDDTLNQECFNKYPLKRIFKEGEVSPRDPEFPDRYYLPPACYKGVTDQSGVPTGSNATGHRFKVWLQLPDIVSEKAVIYWYYWTANSCLPYGYRPEFFDSITNKPCQENWASLTLPSCTSAYPEEFWNCADIKLTSNASEVSKKPNEGGPRPTNPLPTDPNPSVTPTNPPANGKWDKNWGLGGTHDSATGQWRRFCGCKQVTWNTPHESEAACVADWFAKDPTCLAIGSTTHPTTTPTLQPTLKPTLRPSVPRPTDPKPTDPAPTVTPRGTWDKDYSLGGQYVPAAGRWLRNCGCKEVNWPTSFSTEKECVDAWLASDSLCRRTGDGNVQRRHYARNWDLGGISTPSGWKRHCDCKPVDWTTNFTDQTECRDEWKRTDAMCL